MQRLVNRLFGPSILVLLILAAAAVQPTLAADGPVKARRARRLPGNLAKVVTEQQREQIFQIQDEYKPKLEALEKQLAALRKEREEKITAVLTADQKKQVDEAAAKENAAKEKAGKEKATKEKAAKEKTATSAKYEGVEGTQSVMTMVTLPRGGRLRGPAEGVDGTQSLMMMVTPRIIIETEEEEKLDVPVQ